MRLKNRSAWVLTLALIIWLAALLRVWNLTKESFWADEGWTMLLSKGPTLSDVTVAMANDQHPPLYFALIHEWIALAGNSEFTTRLLSTFWSLIGVALAYQLGKLLFSPGAGMAAALMLTLADNDIMLAQEARHYTQMATLTLLTTVFYFRYLRRPTRRDGIGWLLSAAALLYTHYLGVFILAVQLIHSLIFARPMRRLRDMLIRWLLIGLAWLPWAFVFIAQASVRYTRPMLYQSTMPNTPETFALVRGDLFGAHFGLTFGLLLLGLAYVAYRNGSPIVRWRPVRPTVYMALWFFLPLAVIVGINARIGILTPRNFLLIAPAIAVLIGHGIMNLDRAARAFILTILIVIGLTTTDAYFIKPPWRQVAQDILNYRIDNDPVLMDIWVDALALRYHIGRDLHTDPANLPLISIPEWSEQYRDAFWGALRDYLNNKDSFWLAYWGDPKNQILKFYNEQGFVRTATQRETHLQTNEILVYRYDRVPETTLAQFGDLFELKRDWIEQGIPDNPSALRVSLLWKAIKPPPFDYSVSVFLLNADGQLVAQHDSSPLDGHSPTSAWQGGDVRFDSHTIRRPAGLPPGKYEIAVKIYWYGDGKPLTVVNPSRSSEYFVIGSVNLS